MASIIRDEKLLSSDSLLARTLLHTSFITLLPLRTAHYRQVFSRFTWRLMPPPPMFFILLSPTHSVFVFFCFFFPGFLFVSLSFWNLNHLSIFEHFNNTPLNNGLLGHVVAEIYDKPPQISFFLLTIYIGVRLSKINICFILETTFLQNSPKNEIKIMYIVF